MLGGNAFLKNPKYALFFLAFFIVIPLIKYGYGEYQKSKSSTDIGIQQAAKKINEISPRKLDEFVQIDSASALPGSVLKVNYRLLQVLKEDLEKDELTDLIAGLKAEVKAEVANGAVVDGQIQYKIKIRRAYYDKKGRFLFDIDEGFEEKK